MKFHQDKTIPTGANVVWVFGSNLAGYHGAGAAKVAAQQFGANLRTAIGREGMSYAIPTKDHKIDKSLPLRNIAANAAKLVAHAKDNPHELFFVTRVGCGLAGYKDAQVAPFFKGAPDNCSFAEEWRPWLDDELPEEL